VCGTHIAAYSWLIGANLSSFAAFVTDSSATVFRQYPEWDMQLRMPKYQSGCLVWYCTQHGLFYQELRAGGSKK
jgi:hypothetical protein